MYDFGSDFARYSDEEFLTFKLFYFFALKLESFILEGLLKSIEIAKTLKA